MSPPISPPSSPAEAQRPATALPAAAGLRRRRATASDPSEAGQPRDTLVGTQTPSGPHRYPPAQPQPPHPTNMRGDGMARVFGVGQHVYRALASATQWAQMARHHLFVAPQNEEPALSSLAVQWQSQADSLAHDGRIARAQHLRARGLMAKVTGLVPARWLARGITIVAALVAWSAGAVAMLPFLLLAAMVLLLWPQAAPQLWSVLQGKPSASELAERQRARHFHTLELETEIYRRAAERAQAFRAVATPGSHGLQLLEQEFAHFERKLLRARAASEQEGVGERMFERMWPGLPLALSWAHAVGFESLARRAALLLPLALYAQARRDPSPDADVQAQPLAEAFKLPAFFGRHSERAQVLERLLLHARQLRAQIRAASQASPRA